MTAVAAPNPLGGVQRAALLLLMLGEQNGGPIWSMLEEEEVKKLSFAMTQLGAVDSTIVETLAMDFVKQLSQTCVISGSYDRTEELLLKFFPQDMVAEIMAEVRGAAGDRMWQRLAQIDPEILANYLRNEYPQTVAVILSRLRADHTAQVLAILPDEFAVDVLDRMLRLEAVQKEALEHIEETLRNEFVTAVAHTNRRDAYKSIAEVFNAFDRVSEERFMTALDQKNREAAKRIRELMFTFEDLLKLDSGAIQTVMRQVDKDTLGRALKGAPEPVRQFFFSNMSTRAAKNLQDEMQGMGPIRLKAVDAAQGKIVDVAKELAERGEIMISKNRAEDELVY
jgi:flagellar motor switch protein FliG